LQFNRKRRSFALGGIGGALALAGLLSSCSTTTPPVAPPAANPVPGPGTPEQPPAAPREFRAAWVSVVANIDWPSKPGLPAARQQAEAIAILDRARNMNLNAIVLQVRPAADAIYPSKFEPWSEYLSGTQGTSPGWDPLKFWVDQAHARGIELHAWFNPYRARHSGAKSANAPNHIANTNPAVVKSYGKFLWMDPGEAAASRQTLDVILDVVRRYDIDGVHLDDYFYPYPEADNGLDSAGNGKEVDFPDQPAWQRYQQSGGRLGRADWRRQNVNQLIEAIYKGVHAEKSWVKFGISPFGLPRPDRRPPGISGFSQYDKLYADAELWLESGWVDYFTPQLYWPVSQTPQAYDVLLDYWISQNRQGRHMWPGLFTSRIGQPTKSYLPEEVLKQVELTRARPGAGGHVHFSMIALTENRQGIADQLKSVHYTTPALVPATPWLAETLPPAPTATVQRNGKNISLKMAGAPAGGQYAVWSRHGGAWRFQVVTAMDADLALAGDASAVFVSAVDRLGNEGPRVPVTLAAR
jgi:uncharacterized lipoprotein YddW (UPF0748 family)